MGWKGNEERIASCRYYQLILILYFLNIFTMLFINFIKNGSGHYLVIIFCQNRDLDLICWSILYRVVLCRRSLPVNQLAELTTMLFQKYQKRIKGDDKSNLVTNGKIFSRPIWYNRLCISNPSKILLVWMKHSWLYFLEELLLWTESSENVFIAASVLAFQCFREFCITE